MECTIDIHGSHVSREVFRNQDNIKVKTYIGKNTIMSTQYPMVRENFSDTSSKNSSWEKRMLNIDFSKNVFKCLSESSSDYLMIDLIDEIYELIKVNTVDGKQSAITNSQCLKKSDFKKMLGLNEVEIINTRNFHFSKIMDAVKNYAHKVVNIYGENHIIINEVYPVECLVDKAGNIKYFDEEKRAIIKRNRYKLELYYALLEHEMPKAYVIKMPTGIMADVNHYGGIASTHFEQKYYKIVYEQTLSYINANSVNLKLPNKSVNTASVEKDVFDARCIKNKNIIIYGAQIYFKDNIEKFKRKYKKIQYLYPDGQIDNELREKYTIIDSVEQIRNIDNCIVIIAKGRTSDISKIADILRKQSILYDHMDFYINEKININYLKALKYYHYIDENNNRFKLDSNISNKLVLKRVACKNATCIIGNNKIYDQLFIQLFGDSPSVDIGKDSTFLDVVINVCSKGKVTIANENMFSHHVTLAQSDMHHIFDLKTGKRINYPKDINIGNHVWIGREVELLGGARIGNNCVVGARTITSSKFPDNVIIAGDPGKIIRENVIWARDDLKVYNHDYYQEANDKLGKKYVYKGEVDK